MSDMRARFREQVQEEVKAAAVLQLAAGGVQAVSVNAIAQQLGVSGPALYRYFRNRDALLDALVIDAYADLQAAVEDSRDLATYACRYRSWALEHPQRYRLLYAPPLTQSPDLSEPVVVAAHGLMHALVRAMGEPRPARMPRTLRDALARWAADRPGDIVPAAGLRAIQVWAALHGFVRLEVDGNFDSMGLDADALFAVELATLG